MHSQTQELRTVQEHKEWARTVRGERPPANLDEYLAGWQSFFDHYAESIEDWRHKNAGYHKSLASLAQFYVPAKASVLEIGSGNGDLLAAIRPARGVGIDISPRMIALSRQKYAHIEFRQGSAERLDLAGETFDYVVLSDLTSFLYDIRLAFERVRSVCHADTRIVMNWYSKAWQPMLNIAEKLGRKYPQPLLNWTTVEDLRNLLYLADFEVVHYQKHVLIPTTSRFARRFANGIVGHLPLLRHLCLTNWIVARPINLDRSAAPTVSVICPCRNEAGNVDQIVQRLPDMGAHTELIFVEGHSKDDTLARCHAAAASNPDKDIRVLVQQGRGKGDAVRLGFSEAKGDILMILDADISVEPEELVRFCEVLVSGKGEFVNGSRLVYTMDPQAMRFLNLLGNRFFATLLSKLIGQPIKDSLCGTKVMWRHKYEELAAARSYFGDIDPFGDFDLLFGAAKLNLKIVEIPVRYRQRIYGSTNINRFADGLLLLRMSAKAASKLYFVS